MSYELPDETIAEAYLSDRIRNGYGNSSEDLVDFVEDYLDRVGLTWRSAAAVARAVDKLAQPPAPRPGPQHAPADDPAGELAFVNDIRQGTTATDPMGLLPDVANMSMAEYARARVQLGIGK